MKLHGQTNSIAELMIQVVNIRQKQDELTTSVNSDKENAAELFQINEAKEKLEKEVWNLIVLKWLNSFPKITLTLEALE